MPSRICASMPSMNHYGAGGVRGGVVCLGPLSLWPQGAPGALHDPQRKLCELPLEVLRDLTKRGLQTPVTITTDGAVGLSKAVDFVWPRSLRIRCWFHKMQDLMQK